MLRLLFITIISTFFLNANFGQSDDILIRNVLNDFIEGTVYNYPEKILSAFHPGSKMFLHNDADTLLEMTVEKYASFYDNGRAGQKNERYGSIITIDQCLDVAYAKLQVDLPYNGKRYYDLVILKKINGHWKITSKATSAEPLPSTNEHINSIPKKRVMLDSLHHPWSMAFISESSALVAEKDGDLLKVNVFTGEKIIISGLPNDIGRAILIDTSLHEKGVFPSSAHGNKLSFNAGLFQVLLDPDFDSNNYIYLSYAAVNNQNAHALKVIRGRLIDNQLKNLETLLTAGAYSHGLFHFGGGMVFGNDGKLYITTGERNLFEHHNPELPLSQDMHDLRGKVLRINPDGTSPLDNPFVGTDADDRIFALGIRAAQGLIVRPNSDEIWFTDHGTIQGDEVNILEAGANYGWPYKTSGRYRSKDYNPPYSKDLKFKDPVYFWDQTIAPTGLCFYTGKEFPKLKDMMIVPGLSKGNLWALQLHDNHVASTQELFVNDRIRLRKAVMSPYGKLYILTDEDNGKIIRITIKE